MVNQGSRVLNGRFQLFLHFLYDVKFAISARWLANPNYTRSQFPHDFWSSYEYVSHCQIEDSLSYLMTPQASLILTIETKSVADSERVV